MADQNQLVEAGSRMIQGVLGGTTWVVVLILVVGVVGGIVYYFVGYRRKFDILVKIISERASDPRIFFDKGAILIDRKKGTKYLKLLSTKVELNVPPFKIIEATNKGDYIELWRKSQDEFVYLTKPIIDKTKVIRADGRLYPVSTPLQRHHEGDLYWVIKRKEDNKQLLTAEALWAKLLAWAPQIIGGIIVMLMLWITLSKLPGLIDQLTTLTREITSLKGADIITG